MDRHLSYTFDVDDLSARERGVQVEARRTQNRGFVGSNLGEAILIRTHRIHVIHKIGVVFIKFMVMV